MYSRFHCFIHFFIVLVMGIAAVLVSHGQAPASTPAIATPSAASPAPAPKAILRGHIADPTGALIPGATVTIKTAAGISIATTKSDPEGLYAVTNLAPDSYIKALGV